MREQHEPNSKLAPDRLNGRGRAPARSSARRRYRWSSIALVGAVGLGAAGCAGDSEGGVSATDPGGDNAVSDNTSAGRVESDQAPSDAAGEQMESDRETADSPSAAPPATDVSQEDAEAVFTEDTEAANPPEDDTFDGANFVDYGQRPFVETAADPLSTFALDVDHGSYTITRAALDASELPPPAAIRPEEFVNSFRYDYPSPDAGLAVTVDGTRSPFVDDPNLALMRVGVSAEQIPDDERPPVALTFVVDTSGSMETPNRLPMVQYSLRTLAESLQPDDTLAIVNYSNDADVVLAPTPVSDSDEIESAIDDLGTSGGTNLEAGLARGYELADEAYREDGINAVLIASDGIANIGSTTSDGVLGRISEYADEGISLVTLGYGMEGYNDQMMEQLANDGDGFYAYIDAEREARRLFEDEITSTLVTVAKDSKVQVEFNPELVAEYRLIGYENRAVLDSDFRNDEVDAGELGAGHEATAIYEVKFHDGADPASDAVVASVHLRWESPDSGEVTETDVDVTAEQLGTEWDEAGSSLRLAVAATGFAERLRYSGFDTSTKLTDLAEIADDEGENELADQMYVAARLLGES